MWPHGYPFTPPPYDTLFGESFTMQTSQPFSVLQLDVHVVFSVYVLRHRLPFVHPKRYAEPALRKAFSLFVSLAVRVTRFISVESETQTFAELMFTASALSAK